MSLEKEQRIADPRVVARVRARDPYCQVCGRPRTDVHHIKTRGSGGDDVEENLIGLCRECHSKAHNGEVSRERLLRVLRDKWGYDV